ncbi:MAG: hypothetical protein JSS32_05200 [Verrucomicrobia bacterium]|nr:hypothetical protein [Verrucomicrobiota bacterium]
MIRTAFNAFHRTFAPSIQPVRSSLTQLSQRVPLPQIQTASFGSQAKRWTKEDLTHHEYLFQLGALNNGQEWIKTLLTQMKTKAPQVVLTLEPKTRLDSFYPDGMSYPTFGMLNGITKKLESGAMSVPTTKLIFNLNKRGTIEKIADFMAKNSKHASFGLHQTTKTVV